MYNNQFLVRFLFLSLCLCVNACIEKQKDWEIINAQLESEFEIGNDSTAFLSHPLFLVVDSDGHIIVADRGRSELLVFDNHGQFMHTIGGRGPGPGEFRDIRGMHINDSDEIMVFDRSSQTLKTFSVSGSYLKSYMLPSPPITTRVRFKSWENVHLLFYIRPNPGYDQNYIMHLYSNGFDRVITKAIPSQSLDDFSDAILPLLITNAGSTLILNNRLLFTPAIYNGYIYEYALSRSDLSVNFIKKYPGNTHMEQMSIVSRNRSNSSEYADVTVSSPETTMRILTHNRSKGLFELKNGNIIHFTYIENGEGSKRTFGFELYDQTMEPLGYASLHIRPFSADPAANNLLGWEVVAKDEDDRFYIIDTTQDIPKIRVARLNKQVLNQ